MITERSGLVTPTKESHTVMGCRKLLEFGSRSGLYMWMQENEKNWCILYCVPDKARNGQSVA